MVEFCTVNGTYWTLRTNLVNPKRFLLRHVQYQNFQVNGTAWTKQRFGLIKSIFLIVMNEFNKSSTKKIHENVQLCKIQCKSGKCLSAVSCSEIFVKVSVGLPCLIHF